MHLKKQTLSSFFSEAGFDHAQMEIDKFYPLEEKWEILTRDASGKNTWKRVTHLVRKESTVPIVVTYLDTQLFVSPEHRFFVRICGDEKWIEAIDLLEENDIFLLHETGEWVSATLTAGSQEIDILDMTVEGTECYYSGGVLSHNTMHGDPMTVPGGHAIPFHASVRIKLGAGQQILNKEKEVIGIHVSAKTIKNKISAPFRKCEFEIHFGVGIKEHEQVFDVLRASGPASVNGNRIEISGAGAWKTLTVMKEDTGEIIVDKKFYKAEFGKIIADPEYSEFIDDLLDAVMTKKRASEDLDIDPESYEEIRAVAMEMETPDSSPED